MSDTSAIAGDVWSAWLLGHRQGGDVEVGNAIRRQAARYAEHVLDGARIGAGMTLVDIGSGDSLVAFQAISRIGVSLQVVLTDISPVMLRHVEALTRQSQISSQCRFIHCDAEQLDGIADASVDAVVTRAVLAYVVNKPAALRECLRILKPGGRLSICEPIMRDEALAVYALKAVIDSQSPAARDRLLELECRIRAAEYPDTLDKMMRDPTTNFTERDLFRLAQEAGFQDVHMEFHIDTHLERITKWEAFLDRAPHPLSSSVRTIMEENFTEDERQYFSRNFLDSIKDSLSKGISRNAFLTAQRSMG